MTNDEFLERFDRGSNFTQRELRELSEDTIVTQFINEKNGHKIIYRFFESDNLSIPRFFCCESTDETCYQPVETEPPSLTRAWRTGKSPWRKKKTNN